MLPDEFYDLFFRLIREFEDVADELNQMLEDYVRKHPNSVEAWLMLGDLRLLCLDEDEDEQSLECLQKAYELDATDPEANVQLAEYVEAGAACSSERVRQHLQVFLANCIGHRDESTLLFHAFELAKEHDLRDLAATIPDAAVQRSPDDCWMT